MFAMLTFLNTEFFISCDETYKKLKFKYSDKYI